MIRVNELWDFFGGNHLQKDIPLSDNTSSRLLNKLCLSSLLLTTSLGFSGLGFLCGFHLGFHLSTDLWIIFRKLWWNSKLFNFRFQFIGSRLNWHSCTVKCKWKQDLLSLVTLILSSEDSLGQGKCVTNVQVTVGIRVWKGNHKGFLVLIVGWIHFIGLLFFPKFLDGNFIGAQSITLGCSFASCFGSNVKVLHSLGCFVCHIDVDI
mmetsp:Transcript_34262/g.83108  ORF Transcript_34262/g.83108 Transcript_34262/m.83108 type:complete len:207 (+) Transcript_34262:2810-3430(+)